MQYKDIPTSLFNYLCDLIFWDDGMGGSKLGCTFTFMHLADAFIQSDIQVIHFFFVSTCVPWESNPTTFVLLTQCSNH